MGRGREMFLGEHAPEILTGPDEGFALATMYVVMRVPDGIGRF